MQNVNPEDCIKFLIDATNLYTCDKNGYIVRSTDNEKIAINSDDKKSKQDLIIPKRVITETNISILNPFNEVLGETENQKWFYITMAMSVSFKIKNILNWTIDYISIKDDLPDKVLKFISKFSEVVDKKTKKEIDIITKDMLDFSNIFYNRKLKTTIFRSGVFEDSFEKKLSSIRKKTWRFLREIFCEIFGFDGKNNDDFRHLFKYKSSKITCPRFDSFMRVYLNVSSCLNDVCDIFDADDFILDIDELSYHIRNIDTYYNKLKWLSQDSVSEVEPKVNPVSESFSHIGQPSIQNQNESFVSSMIRQSTSPYQENISPYINNNVNGIFPGVNRIQVQPVQPFGGTNVPINFGPNVRSNVPW